MEVEIVEGEGIVLVVNVGHPIVIKTVVPLRSLYGCNRVTLYACPEQSSNLLNAFCINTTRTDLA